MSVYESIDAFKLAWVKELLLRSSGNGGVNFIMVHCIFAFYKRYKFYIFSPQIFSFSIFKSTSNGVSYLALINRFGGLKMRCSWDIRDSLLWAICEDLKFGKFCYSKIFVMCVYESIDAFKLAWVKNCSWGQVVTEAWILLWCIVCLRFTNDINSIFFPLKFSVFLFSNRRAMGSHILHSSIGLEG